jgi:hypothetical protein
LHKGQKKLFDFSVISHCQHCAAYQSDAEFDLGFGRKGDKADIFSPQIFSKPRSTKNTEHAKY